MAEYNQLTHEITLARDISSEGIFLHTGLVEGVSGQMLLGQQSARLPQLS